MMDYKRYLFEQDVEELHRNFDYLSDLDEFDLQDLCSLLKSLLRM